MELYKCRPIIGAERVTDSHGHISRPSKAPFQNKVTEEINQKFTRVMLVCAVSSKEALSNSGTQIIDTNKLLVN